MFERKENFYLISWDLFYFLYMIKIEGRKICVCVRALKVINSKRDKYSIRRAELGTHVTMSINCSIRQYADKDKQSMYLSLTSKLSHPCAINNYPILCVEKFSGKFSNWTAG